MWERYEGKVWPSKKVRIEVNRPDPEHMHDVEAILIEKVAMAIIWDLGLEGWTVTVNRDGENATIPEGGYAVMILPQTRVDC